MMETKEEAIPLLIFDPVKKVFSLSEQGEELLKSMKGEFAVISVAGMYRTGKSYLLNQMLLNRTKGFSVGPTINPCTKGLWMWNKPILGLDSYTNSKIPILLIDTEGFGAFDEDQNHDIKIFTLAVLLSSYFIYNSTGSIDENAIQNLSFVINLSKSIQLKGKSESDPEELSALFPSFLWLVRDFSLQLVDDDGDTITPKEYLEKVLDTSKSTYEMDEKSRIRKLIKSYFKDRDCHTMVRPITDESKLQDLQNISTDKLRPDFVEGIIQLRKKISNKIKPKQLNKNPLNGEMFVNMIKSFIEAINKGAVPNIENTWSSMCRVECLKAFEIAESNYENYLRENLGDSLASGGSINTTEFIQGVHKVAKDNALALFKKKAIGDSIEENLKSLKALFKERLKHYEEQAEEGNRVEMYKKLKQFFAYFENKIYNPKSSDDEITVEKIDEELKKMEMKINERFGDFRSKTEIFNEFKANVFYFVGEYLKKNNAMNIDQVRKEKEELQRKLAEEVEEHKALNLKDIKKKNTVIESMKTELLEQKEQVSNLKHKVISLEKDNDILQKSCEEKIMRLKDEYERRLNEVQKSLISQDEKVREAERKVIQIENDKSREIALLEQSNQHKAKQIEELKKVEKESGVEMKLQLKEATNALKESNIKYEQKIKQLNSIIDQLREELVESDSNFKKTESLYENEKEKSQDLQTKLKSEKEDGEIKMNLLKKKLETDRAKILEESSNKEKESQMALGKLKIQYEELELKSKSVEDELKNQLNSLQREYSVHVQSHGFLEEKNKDLQNQIDEQKKNYEGIIQRLESKTFSMIGNEEYQKRLEEIKNFYEKEKQQNEDTFENQKKIYLKQIDQLNESKNEAEIRNRADMDDREKRMGELQAKYDKAIKDIKQIQTEKKMLSDCLTETHDEMEERLKQMVHDAEKKLEEKEYSHQKEINDLNTQSEEAIKQLKMMYETEKIRMEDRMKDERNKTDKKIKLLIAEYEEKLKEVTEESHNEYFALEEEFKNYEQRMTNYESQAENEINLLNHKVDALEKGNADLKERLAAISSTSQKSLESINEKFEKERKELNERIELLQSDQNSKDKEIVLLKSDKDRLEGVIREKDEYIIKVKSESEDEKKDLNARVEEYNRRYQEGHDKFLTEKLEFTKEIAVLKQQIDFSKKKNDEQRDQIESSQIRYEEKLFSLRKEVEADFNEKFEKLRLEKEGVEEKLLAKKKDMKESEQSFVKQINNYEKEIALLKERLSSTEQQKKEMQETLEKEILYLTSTTQNQKGGYQKEMDDLFKGNDTLKQKITTLTSELQEARTHIEKDKILYENKMRFLETQRDAYKSDLAESQKKYDQMIDSITKKHSDEKEKLEKSCIDKVASIESKYILQIKDSNDKHNNVYTELFNSNKNLEKELKNLKLELDIKTKSFDPTQSTKTIEELGDQLEKVKVELEITKKGNQAKTNEIRATMEKDKDTLKAKINEMECKLKEMEAKRSNTLFEMELDRGKWQNEKEHLLSSINELKDQVETLQGKIETLTKDNVKLKSEKANLGRGTKPGAGTGVANRVGGVSMGSGISGRGSNPYANFVSGASSGGMSGLSGFGSKLVGLGMEKMLDADVSDINTSTQSINKKDVFSKFSKFKADLDDNMSDK